MSRPVAVNVLNGAVTYAPADPYAVGALRLLSGAPLPVAMASPPTISQGADNAASTVTAPVAYSPATRADLFTVTGGTIALGGTGGDPSFFIGANITPYGTSTFAPYAVEVVTDSAKLDITVRATGARFRVLVDGALANTEDGALLATSAGANKRIIIDFGTKALRTIRLESDGSLRMGSWTLSTTDVILPAVRRGPRCIVAGDSITEGTGATGRFQGWARLLGWHLGWPDTWASGSGGTGYTDDGSPTYTGRKIMGDRMATDVIAHDPDVVVLAAGRNDTDAEPAAVQAAATACISAVLTALPAVRLYVLGPLYLGTSAGQSTVLATDAAIAAAVAAAGGTFVSVVTPNYLFGTGKVTATTGNGPCDTLLSSDGVHPSPEGHRALARLVAAAIAADLARA